MRFNPQAHPDFLEAITRAALARQGVRLGNGEIRFQCVHPEAHKHGDADASCRWNPKPTKAVYRCDVCGAKGGSLELARLLRVPLPEWEGNPRASRGGKKTCENPEHIMARETAWNIRDPAGAVVAEHVRFDFKDGRKTFVWRRNGKNKLDGLPV